MAQPFWIGSPTDGRPGSKYRMCVAVTVIGTRGFASSKQSASRTLHFDSFSPRWEPIQCPIGAEHAGIECRGGTFHSKSTCSDEAAPFLERGGYVGRDTSNYWIGLDCAPRHLPRGEGPNLMSIPRDATGRLIRVSWPLGHAVGTRALCARHPVPLFCFGAHYPILIVRGSTPRP